MQTFQFLVTIDSEREITPRDVMEAFESSKAIRLDADYVAVQVVSQDVTNWLHVIANSGATAFTLPKGKRGQ